LVQDALVNDDTGFLTYELRRILYDEGLDLLVITDSNGTVVARGQADDPLARRPVKRLNSSRSEEEGIPDSGLRLQRRS